MGRSPLFKNSYDLLLRSRAQFEKSAAGTVMREADAALKGRRFSPGKLSKALSRVKQYAGQPHRLIREAVGAEMGEIVGELARYARNPKEATAIEAFLEALGPAGKAIKAIVEPIVRGRIETTRSLTAAVNLVRAMGAEVLPALKIKSGPEFDRALEAVQIWAAHHGYTLERPGVPWAQMPEAGHRGPKIFRQPIKGRKTVDVPMAEEGKFKRYKPDHPMLTGEFVTCPNSTQVHSFGYDLPNAILYVRYYNRDDDGQITGPGPLYRYSPVEPELFDSFYKTRRGGDGHGGAGTPGTWLWTHVRVRGTISGHQKDYALVGIMDQYVPRKATVHPDYGEILIERKVRTLDGGWLRSRRPHGEIANTRLSRVIQAGNVNRGRAPTGRPEEVFRAPPKTGRP